ncbi:MAG: nicotinate phosphoribosyltransferase [Bacteroidales bacterium]|nr:nicotinate phosphoribosyltransferase [Bacteroidales bacterium]
MEQIITRFTDNDLYTFTCQYYILSTYPRAEVVYSFFDRNGTAYPQGFAALLREHIDAMRQVTITQEEIDFMRRKCYFLPEWYYTFLRGFRFNPAEVCIAQDEAGHLQISVQGKWYSAIIWEMPILSLISELMHRLNGDTARYDLQLETERARQKAVQIFSNGLVFGDMGTRRRFSLAHHDMVVRVMKEVYASQSWPGTFTGTSNVWLAMKHDTACLGTMSHQLISFEEIVSGVFECNFNVMKKFSDVYDGDNGIYLYDCFGDKVFFGNLSKRMAMMYKGLRVDSGNEEEQTEKIIEKYKSLGIDPATKQVVYSNGLDIERAIGIHRYCAGRVQDSYGVGTFLTCDITGCKPMNIVVKLTRGRITELREWHDCVKISCDKGKTLGNAEKCRYLQTIIETEEKA